MRVSRRRPPRPQPPPPAPASWPKLVRCYGCCAVYDPAALAECDRHSRHAADAGHHRVTLLHWLDTVQRERDALAVELIGARDKLARWPAI